MKRFITRVSYVVLTTLITVCNLPAQRLQQGGQALGKAAQELESNFVQPVITFAYVVCLIMGVAGAVRVFKKLQDGDQDAAKSGGALIGGAIFFVIIIYLFQQFFGGASTNLPTT